MAQIDYKGWGSAKEYQQHAQEERKQTYLKIDEKQRTLGTKHQQELEELQARHTAEQTALKSEIEKNKDWWKLDARLNAVLEARDKFRKAVKQMAPDSPGYSFYQAKLIPFIADPDAPVQEAPIRIESNLTPEEVRQIANEVAQETGLTKDRVADLLSARGVDLKDERIENDPWVEKF